MQKKENQNATAASGRKKKAAEERHKDKDIYLIRAENLLARIRGLGYLRRAA